MRARFANKSLFLLLTWFGFSLVSLIFPTSIMAATPSLEQALAASTKIAAGDSFRLIVRNDGTVWGWGSNSYGQLGDATTITRTAPVQALGLTDITAISATYRHCLALKSDGTVWAWGYNDYGQIGNSATTNQTFPLQVSDLANIVAVSAGYYHSLALDSSGQVWAWGRNNYSQLGDTGITQRNTPVKVHGSHSFIAIAAGQYHSLALKADGSAWGWGYNSSGQLGDNTEIIRRSPNQVYGSDIFASISAGSDHSLGLKSDGTIMAWGSNTFGQLGDGTTENKHVPVAVLYSSSPVTPITNISAISAANSHSIALNADGTVVAWGKNNVNQLGDGSSTNQLFPVPMVTSNNPGKPLGPVCGIRAGYECSVVLETDGTLRGSFGSTPACSVDLCLAGSLSALTVGSATMSPAFNPNVLEYTVTAPYGTISVDIAPTITDASCQLLIDGQPHTNGAAKTITLSVAKQTTRIDVLHTATGITRTYRLTAIWAAPSTQTANLSSLSVDGATFSPAFDPSLTDYTITLDPLINNIDIAATTAFAAATVNIADSPTVSGTQTMTVDLLPGNNAVTVVGTSQDATQQVTYTLHVVRGLPENALLKSIRLNVGTLDPIFDQKTVAYQVTGAGTLKSIDITVETVAPTTALTIGGQAAVSGTAQAVNLVQGPNLIPIVITALDGVTQYSYILSLNGTVSNADLDDLTLTGQTLDSPFDAAITDYSLHVANSIDELELTASPSDPRALMILNGSILAPSSPVTVKLAEGQNSITLMVVAQDASTKTYTIGVYREISLAISSADLPAAVVSSPYNFTLQAAGGNNLYTWSATGLPAWLSLNPNTGVLSGTPDTGGPITLAITAEDGTGLTATKDLPLNVYSVTGKGGYMVVPAADSAYIISLSKDALPVMTVKGDVSGFKYFSVIVNPVAGHAGNETMVFIHMRNNTPIAVTSNNADYDIINAAGAGFNVMPGDVIKAYLVDGISNNINTSPIVL